MEDERRAYGNATMHENIGVITLPLYLNLSSDFKQAKIRKGVLHSEFERVQNYLFEIHGEKRMLTIMREGNTLLPDSMILKAADYECLKNQGELEATIEQDFIRIGNIKIAVGDNFSCSLKVLSLDKFTKACFEDTKKQIEKFIECSEKKSDLERLPKRYICQLDVFIKSILENEPKNAEESFLSLVGAGRGLTPAADDALVGALAGSLLGLTLSKKQDRYFTCVENILSHLCTKKLTTEISCKYLKCACRGEFSQNLCELIRALAGEENADMDRLLGLIAETGHSSGMDMLYGLQKVLSYICRNTKGKENGR